MSSRDALGDRDFLTDLMSELPGVDVNDPQIGLLLAETEPCQTLPHSAGSEDATMQSASASPEVPPQLAPHRKLTGKEPEEVAKIAQATASPALAAILDTMLGDGRVRGCMVDSRRPYLQALQSVLRWTIGGYDTRPTEESTQLKDSDRLAVLLRYRQDAPPPHVAMYEYLCDTLFGVPMKPVGDEVQVQQYIDMDGQLVTAQWEEADWHAFDASAAPRCAFAPNRYPYQLNVVGAADAHELQRTAQHWILWYFHAPPHPLADPTDDQIETDVRMQVQEVVKTAGFDRVDYIWYRNPFMSVPDMFHVQVFWIVP